MDIQITLPKQSEENEADISDHGDEEWKVNRDHHKKLADEAFRSGKFVDAIQEYTVAISFDPDNHILFSNRSAAYLSNNERSKALVDAKTCVELNPEFIRGHSRLAACFQSLHRYHEAISVFRHILSLDPNNEIAKTGIDDCLVYERHKRGETLTASNQSKQENTDADEQKAEVQVDVNEEDDLLNNFFEEVEGPIDVDVVEKETSGGKIQIEVCDLGDVKTQIERIMCSHHQWYNLNPYRVLDISHHASDDLVSRRYKALSLLLHPDKIRNSASNDDGILEKAEEAFEYVRKAMEILKNDTKKSHCISLIEEGLKQGKKDYEESNRVASIESFQSKGIMKIFADVEHKRRDVERRQRNQEHRERSQEDAELEKMKKQRDFDKNWKDECRVDKRIGNWRDFQHMKRPKH